MLESSAAILAFALITALVSYSMIDLLARRLVYRRAFLKWRKHHFPPHVLSDLPRSAFGLSSERLSALIANQLRLGHRADGTPLKPEHINGFTEVATEPARDVTLATVEAERDDATISAAIGIEEHEKTRALQREFAVLDQMVDEFQADLIDSDRYLRYIMSMTAPIGLFLLLLNEGSVDRSNIYLLLGCGVSVTLLAAWIQGLRLRAFQSQ